MHLGLCSFALHASFLALHLNPHILAYYILVQNTFRTSMHSSFMGKLHISPCISSILHHSFICILNLVASHAYCTHGHIIAWLASWMIPLLHLISFISNRIGLVLHLGLGTLLSWRLSCESLPCGAPAFWIGPLLTQAEPPRPCICHTLCVFAFQHCIVTSMISFSFYACLFEHYPLALAFLYACFPPALHIGRWRLLFGVLTNQDSPGSEHRQRCWALRLRV